MSDGIRLRPWDAPSQDGLAGDLRLFWILRGFEKLVIKRERERAAGHGFGEDYQRWLRLDRKVTHVRRMLLRAVLSHDRKKG